MGGIDFEDKWEKEIRTKNQKTYSWNRSINHKITRKEKTIDSQRNEEWIKESKRGEEKVKEREKNKGKQRQKAQE